MSLFCRFKERQYNLEELAEQVRGLDALVFICGATALVRDTRWGSNQPSPREARYEVDRLRVDYLSMRSPMEILLTAAAGMTGIIAMFDRVVASYEKFHSARASAAKSSLERSTYQLARQTLEEPIPIHLVPLMDQDGAIDRAAQVLLAVESLEVRQPSP